MKRIAFICIIAFVSAGILSAQSVKELEKQRKATLQQLETTGKLLNETKKNEKVSLNKLNILNRSISERKRLINDIGTEITALDTEMAELNIQKADLETQLCQLKADYARLVQETAYSRNRYAELMFVLSADSFNQMYRRLRYLREFADYRKEQVQQIEEVQAQIAQKNDALLQNRQSKQEVLQLKEREHEKLARDERREKLMLNELKKKEKDLLAQQKNQQKKADELNSRIEKLIAEEIRKAEAAKKKTTTTGTQKPTSAESAMTKEEELLAGGFERNKGRLPWPTETGFISGRFGVQPHPVLEHVTINNKGIYIQTKAGATARAVYEGEVTQRFAVPGSNNAVIVKHGNYRTVYANLTEIYVQEGDKVSAKQAIGRIYCDGENDNKTELYFQVWKDKSIENPALWLAK